jgi:hypothetical protein
MWSPVKKGRRYRYCVSTEAGRDRPQVWRLAAQEIEDAVVKVLDDALTRPAMLLERLGTAGIPSDQIRKMLNRATRFAAGLPQTRYRPHSLAPVPQRNQSRAKRSSRGRVGALFLHPLRIDEKNHPLRMPPRLPIFRISGETCPSPCNTTRELKVGSGTVQRVKSAMRA